MRVILQENVESLGLTGDIVNVADGYARNYLLPRGKAIVANDRNVKVLNHQKLLADHRRARTVKESRSLAERIEACTCTIAKQAGENDRLYGSVTTMDIEEVLRAEGIDIDRRTIKLDEPIKNIGVFTVDVKVHPEVVAKLKVYVVNKD